MASYPTKATSSASDAAQLRQLLHQQECVRIVVESISSELELQPLLEEILRQACQLIGAELGSIGLVDPARDLIRTAAMFHMFPAELSAEMPRGVGLSGAVLERGRPVVLDRYGDLPHPIQRDLLEHAVIGLPIEWGGRLIGVLGVGKAPGEDASPGPFGEEAVRTLELFARSAAIAITNAQRYQQERQRSERLALVARVARLVTTDLRLDDMLQRAADAIHELLDFPNIAIALVDPECPNTIAIRAFGGYYKQLMKGEYRFPVSAGLIGAAARSRTTVIANDAAADPRYLPTPVGAPGRAELAVPILLGERALGVVNVERDEPFENEDAAIIGIIADQLAVAIESARLYSGAQDVAVLEERQRLARELHDAVTQHLSSLTLIAQTLGPAYRRSHPEGEERAQRLVELSQVALDEMRVLLAELRPTRGHPSAEAPASSARARLRRQGLADALTLLAADVSRDGLQVHTDLTTYTARPLPQEEALYRIAQEALSNVVKHAKATCVTLRLATGDGATVLSVTDDGVGFPATVEQTGEHAIHQGGLGLLTMRERAAALIGGIRIDSVGGVGTTVEVRVPLAEEGPA